MDFQNKPKDIEDAIDYYLCDEVGDVYVDIDENGDVYWIDENGDVYYWAEDCSPEDHQWLNLIRIIGNILRER